MSLIRKLIGAAVLSMLAVPAFACDVTMPAVIATLDGPPKDDYDVFRPDSDPIGFELFKLRIDPIYALPLDDITAGLILRRGDIEFFGVETRDGCFSAKPILLSTGPKVSA